MKNNFKCDRLSVEIYENKNELGRAAADLAEKEINDAIRQRGETVKNTLEGSISPDVTASILKNHPQATLLLDIPSASSLTKHPNG